MDDFDHWGREGFAQTWSNPWAEQALNIEFCATNKIADYGFSSFVQLLFFHDVCIFSNEVMF